MAVQPPRPRLPPLNALRAFESAARTGSFARAAEEIGVTTAAIAQQVKGLEAWLGCPLFLRLAQGIRLTDRAVAALPSLVGAFDALGLAVRDLTAAARPHRIEIAALPSVASLWLAPRLAGLRAAFPDVTVSLTAIEAPPNLRREPYDLALFLVDGPMPGARCIALARDRCMPVCSPAVAPPAGADRAAWLRGQTLLHDTAWPADWRRWLDAAGMADMAATEGPRFSLYSLAVQAALDGGGVLLGHAALLGRHLHEGSLVAPMGRVTDTGRHLAILLPEQPAGVVSAVAAWLEQAATA